MPLLLLLQLLLSSHTIEVLNSSNSDMWTLVMLDRILAYQIYVPLPKGYVTIMMPSNKE